MLEQLLPSGLSLYLIDQQPHRASTELVEWQSHGS